eukprot:9768555-Alexandrium_andersonii.AAC.1
MGSALAARTRARASLIASTAHWPKRANVQGLLLNFPCAYAARRSGLSLRRLATAQPWDAASFP